MFTLTLNEPESKARYRLAFMKKIDKRINKHIKFHEGWLNGFAYIVKFNGNVVTVSIISTRKASGRSKKGISNRELYKNETYYGIIKDGFAHADDDAFTCHDTTQYVAEFKFAIKESLALDVKRAFQYYTAKKEIFGKIAKAFEQLSETKG